MAGVCDRRTFMAGAASAAALAGLPSGAGAPPPRQIVGCVRHRRTGKGIADVVVSDGLSCVRTAGDGSYRLEARAGAQFVFVTVPSGYSAIRFYQPVASRFPKHNFDLDPCPETGGKGCTFVQVTDSEISEAHPRHTRWMDAVKRVAEESKSAFLVHTGDICAHGGMVAHMMMMNALTMGRPVHYCAGNHDLILGATGEAVFTSIFGPCWYSFDAGGVHFCVTPVDHGDHPPGYTMDEVADWLRNDLALVPSGRPVVLFGHMLSHYRDAGKAGVVMGDKRPIDLREHARYAGFVYGHLHDTIFRRHNGVTLICSAPPVAGAIDFSPAGVRVVRVDEQGRITAKTRYGEHPERWQAAPTAHVWETSLAGSIWHATPLVRDGRVYVATVDDGGHATAAVYALEPQTGRIIWRREMANSVKNRLLRVADVLVALDAEGRLSALDPATGACKWTCALPFTHVVINTAPVASPDGKTVVFGLVHHLAAVDARTGAVKWSVAHGGTEGVPQRFAVDGARVYGISSWDGIYAYALSDGRLAWKIKDRGACVYPGADLLLADGSLYAFLHRTIREIDPEKGTEKRKVQLPAAYNFGVASGAVHVTPSRFVVGTAASGCVAIDRARLAPLWKTDFSPALVTTTPYTGASLPAGNVSPVRVAPNVLCAPAADGAVHFFREDDGRALSRETCGVPYLAGAALTEQGLVVVADMGGFVRAYRPPAGKKEKA